MPSKYREELEDGCVVAKGRDRQLMIYTLESFDKKGREIEELPDTVESRDLARVFFGGAEVQAMDKAGRILIKEELRRFAGLELGSEVAVVGVRRGIEVWKKEDYLRAREQAEETYLARGV